MGEVKKHTMSVLVANKFGVLSRIAGLFSGRGYNISSLTVNATHDPEISQMTIVTTGDEAVLEQIEKQLNKLIDVIRVDDLTSNDFIGRELALFKIKAATTEVKSQVLQLAEVFRGNVVSVRKNSVGVEISGDADKIDSFMRLAEEFGIIEMARSGRVAISRDPV